MRRRSGRSSAARPHCCSCGPASGRCSPGPNLAERGPADRRNCLRWTREENHLKNVQNEVLLAVN